MVICYDVWNGTAWSPASKEQIWLSPPLLPSLMSSASRWTHGMCVAMTEDRHAGPPLLLYLPSSGPFKDIEKLPSLNQCGCQSPRPTTAIKHLWYCDCYLTSSAICSWIKYECTYWVQALERILGKIKYPGTLPSKEKRKNQRQPLPLSFQDCSTGGNYWLAF